MFTWLLTTAIANPGRTLAPAFLVGLGAVAALGAPLRPRPLRPMRGLTHDRALHPTHNAGAAGLAAARWHNEQRG